MHRIGPRDQPNPRTIAVDAAHPATPETSALARLGARRASTGRTWRAQMPLTREYSSRVRHRQMTGGRNRTSIWRLTRRCLSFSIARSNLTCRSTEIHSNPQLAETQSTLMGPGGSRYMRSRSSGSTSEILSRACSNSSLLKSRARDSTNSLLATRLARTAETNSSTDPSPQAVRLCCRDRPIRQCFCSLSFSLYFPQKLAGCHHGDPEPLSASKMPNIVRHDSVMRKVTLSPAEHGPVGDPLQIYCKQIAFRTPPDSRCRPRTG